MHPNKKQPGNSTHPNKQESSHPNKKQAKSPHFSKKQPGISTYPTKTAGEPGSIYDVVFSSHGRQAVRALTPRSGQMARCALWLTAGSAWTEAPHLALKTGVQRGKLVHWAEKAKVGSGGKPSPLGSAGQGVEGPCRGLRGSSVHSACDLVGAWLVCPQDTRGPAGRAAPVGRGWDKGFRGQECRGTSGLRVQTDALVSQTW